MPSIRKITVNPKATVVEDRSVGATGQRESVVEVKGLMCNSLCVARVRRNLLRLPVVDAAEFQESPDRFVVRYRSTKGEGELFTRAAESAVVAPGVRRFLESMSDQARRHR